MARKLDREGGLYGFNFDDLDITSRSIKADGDFEGIGDMDLLINFNKRANIKKVTLSVDYYDYDARAVESWSFSSYKKYNKAIQSSQYENFYGKALNDFGSGDESRMQNGIDAIEQIPGVKDLYFQLRVFDGSTPSLFLT